MQVKKKKKKKKKGGWARRGKILEDNDRALYSRSAEGADLIVSYNSWSLLVANTTQIWQSVVSTKIKSGPHVLTNYDCIILPLSTRLALDLR